MTLRLLSPTALRAALCLTVALAFATTPHAQTPVLVIDDFEDQDLSEYTILFSGAEGAGIELESVAPGEGTSAALRVTVDAAEAGGFAGFGRDLPGAPVDASGVDDPYLVFELDAVGTFTLEINHQNPNGAVNGEIRNALRFIDATAGNLTTYALPLATFLSTQPAPADGGAVFDVSEIQNVIFTFTDFGTTGSPSLVIDDIRIVDGIQVENAIAGLTFDDADFSDTNGFFFFGDALNAGATTDTPDGSANGISVTVDGDDAEGFAGFGATLPNAPVDITSASTLNFSYKSDGAARLEVNIQTEAASGSTQDEGRDTILLSDTDGEYRAVSIPLEAFIQTRAEVPDFSDVYNVVMTFLDVEGDGNAETDDLAVSIDGIGFGTPITVGSEELPQTFSTAPVAFPNPTTGAATIAFELATPSEVRAELFDLLGRRVATLADGTEAAGEVRLAVPANTLVPGTYIVRIQTDAGAAMTRITVAR